MGRQNSKVFDFKDREKNNLNTDKDKERQS